MPLSRKSNPMPNDAAPVLDRSLVLDRFLPYRLSVLTNRVSDAIARLYSERLSLTARGRAVYDEIVPLALHLEDTLISALSKDDLAQLSRLMAKLDKQVSRLAAPDNLL